MNVVVVGAAGQVGRECVPLFKQAGYKVISVTRDELDLEDIESIRDILVSKSPDFILNCSAYTAVDKAEDEADIADRINHLAVAEMAKVCIQLNCPFIHISTDYVFDGSSSVPYGEEDLPNPQTVYGKTKLHGEQAIQAGLEKYIILRTSWVFGEHGNNFVKTMLRLAESRDVIGVVDDQVGCPTSAGHIAEVILSIVNSVAETQSEPWGVYHFSGDSALSWYEFACEIFDRAESVGLLEKPITVNPIKGSDFPVKAVRPNYSVLSNEKISKVFPVQYPWRDGLRQLIEKLISE